MKQLLGLVLAIMVLSLILGCGSTPPTQPNANNGVDHSVALVERPQFIETRPAEIVALYTEDLSKVPPAIANKKPPPPPPDDTTSGDPNPNPAHKYA